MRLGAGRSVGASVMPGGLLRCARIVPLRRLHAPPIFAADQRRHCQVFGGGLRQALPQGAHSAHSRRTWLLPAQAMCSSVFQGCWQPANRRALASRLCSTSETAAASPRLPLPSCPTGVLLSSISHNPNNSTCLTAAHHPCTSTLPETPPTRHSHRPLFIRRCSTSSPIRSTLPCPSPPRP